MLIWLPTAHWPGKYRQGIPHRRITRPVVGRSLLNEVGLHLPSCFRHTPKLKAGFPRPLFLTLFYNVDDCHNAYDKD